MPEMLTAAMVLSNDSNSSAGVSSVTIGTGLAPMVGRMGGCSTKQPAKLNIKEMRKKTKMSCFTGVSNQSFQLSVYRGKWLVASGEKFLLATRDHSLATCASNALDYTDSEIGVAKFLTNIVLNCVHVC